jgi:hypothetical protein
MLCIDQRVLHMSELAAHCCAHTYSVTAPIHARIGIAFMHLMQGIGRSHSL